MSQKYDHNSRPDGKTGSSLLVSKRITDALRSAILTGELKPGSRVRQEELASEFGISRIPVREALRQLESEGLVILVPNSGAWICRLDRSECLEIYKIREQLEPFALQESAANLSRSQLARLEELVEQIETSDSSDEFLRLDREFHLLSYAGADMPQLHAMIQKFWNSTQHYRRAFSNAGDYKSMEMVYHEHQLILDALKRRDGEQAALTVYGHIRRTRLSLENHPGIFD